MVVAFVWICRGLYDYALLGADHLLLGGCIWRCHCYMVLIFYFPLCSILAGASGLLNPLIMNLNSQHHLRQLPLLSWGLFDLALFFSYHVSWPQGFDHAFNYEAAIVTIAAMIALF